jgi:peptidoglycan DL-endopeptidase CwlO
VERLPHGRHQQHNPRPAGSRNGGSRRRRISSWSRLSITAGALALIGVLIPAGVAGATPAAPRSGTPNLKATLAKITKISNEIDALGQEYDSLRIQLTQARKEAQIARQTVRRDQKLLASGQAALGQIAAEGYMSGGVSSTLTLLQTSSPQQYLDKASIMLQLQKENGDKVNVVQAAKDAAARAKAAATQEEARALRLRKAMRKKVALMQAKERELNSSAYRQALKIFQKTGKYPVIMPKGNQVPVEALRYALKKVGDWYQWGAAGPTTFDCSGLVVWAYAQLGISLPHFTGDIWQLGVHIPRDQLEPGDLVFFFAGEEHMGIYYGHGLMLDAPSTGQQVQIQPMLWSAYDGAVRIV